MRWWGWVIVVLLVWWAIVNPHGAAHAVSTIAAGITSVLSGHGIPVSS